MTDKISEQFPISENNEPNAELRPSNSDFSLQFPQILLETSFESLLSHSYITANSSPSSPVAEMNTQESALGSLSASWASLEDAEYSNEDDLASEATDPGSLLDVHSAEDVQSRGEDDTSSELEQSDDDDDNSDAEESEQRQQKVSIIIPQHPSFGQASNITSNILHRSQITLQESAESLDVPFHSVDHTVKIFSTTEISRLKLRPSQQNDGCVGTIHMVLSSSPLDLGDTRSYRVMLLGKQYTPTLSKVILEKIGDGILTGAALSSSTTSNSPVRYHVVPDSFGPGSTPTASEIIPIDLQLEVQRYHRAVSDDQYNDISLFDDNHVGQVGLTSERDGAHTYKVTDTKWNLPDLAILCVNRSDGQEERYSTYNMQKFVARHKIPTLILRMDKDWNARFDHTLIKDDNSAHMRIVTQPHGHPRILQLLPLDLSTFLNLNTDQLNRHLAFLMNEVSMNGTKVSAPICGSKQETSKPGTYISTLNAGKSRMSRGSYKQYTRIVMQLVAVMVIAASVSFGLTMCKNFVAPSLIPSGSFTTNSSSGVQNMIPASNMTTTAMSSTVAAVTSLTASSMPDPSPSESTYKSNGFQIELLGKSNLLVRVPIHSGKTISKDDLKVQLHRKGQPVSFTVEALFDHVYNLHLDPLDAYGQIEVQIKMLKSLRKETIIVDLGSDSLSVQLQRNMALVQKYINHARVIATQGIEDAMSANMTTSIIQQFQSLVPKVTLESKRIVGKLQDIDHKFVLNNFETCRSAAEEFVVTRSNIIRNAISYDAQKSTARGRALFDELSEATKQHFTTLLQSLKVRFMMQDLSEGLQDRIHSDRLATAQERALKIIRETRFMFKNLL